MTVLRPEAVHPAILSGYGLVAADMHTTADRFGNHARADQSKVRSAGSTTDVRDALRHLHVRTWGATRLVLVDLGDWGAVLTNHKGGSDFHDHWFWAGRTTRATTIRVVDHDARWAKGPPRRRLAYAARIVEVHDADGNTIRSIACSDDGGRWVFETFGEPYPIESTFDYEAPRKQDRFTGENVAALLTSLGPGTLTVDRFLAAPNFVLLNERMNLVEWQRRIERDAVTLDDE